MGGFPDMGPPVVESEGVGQRFRAALEAARGVMSGYDNGVDSVVAGLLACLDDPALALVQWQEQYGVVQVGGGVYEGAVLVGSHATWRGEGRNAREEGFDQGRRIPKSACAVGWAALAAC